MHAARSWVRKAALVSGERVPSTVSLTQIACEKETLLGLTSREAHGQPELPFDRSQSVRRAGGKDHLA